MVRGVDTDGHRGVPRQRMGQDGEHGLRVKSCYFVFQVSLDRDAIFVSADVDEVLSREALLRLRWLFSTTMKLV